MKIYKLTIDTDNGFQILTENSPKELLQKDLYSNFKLDALNCFKLSLERGAKLTDALNVGTTGLYGFPVSNKFYNILKNQNLLDVQFVKINQILNEEYKFAFFNSDLTSKLDYAKCSFVLVEDMLGDITTLESPQINNRDSLLKVYKDFCSQEVFNKIIPSNGYHFVSNFNIYDFDVFRIGHFDKSFYVSERLKLLIETNKITGINFVFKDFFR